MGPVFDIVSPASSALPRHGEGSVAVFPDGRWLLAWTAFYGGFGDQSPGRIMGKWSSNKGATWGEPYVLLENDGKRNVMSVSLAVLRDGTVGFAHSRTDDDTCYEAWPFFRKSVDGGRTFGPHKVMVDMERWHGFPANSRLLELSSGRLLLPLQLNQKNGSAEVWEAFLQAAYSDDVGASWKFSANTVSIKGTRERGGAKSNSVAEPAAFERRGGTVVFLLRTSRGSIYAAESADGGESLSEVYDTGLESPGAPCAVARIPDTGDVLLVWNKARPMSPGSGGPRTPLTAAISRDDGRTWGNFKHLEPDTRYSYMYPALAFDRGTVLVLYSQAQIDPARPFHDIWNHTSLKLARVPYGWFYE